MNTQHTPGPWALNINTWWKTNPYSVTVPRKGVHATAVANIPARATIPEEEALANARLIAAAPDLFDVLLRASDAIKALDGTSIENEKLVDDYRAAIAKATGGQP